MFGFVVANVLKIGFLIDLDELPVRPPGQSNFLLKKLFFFNWVNRFDHRINEENQIRPGFENRANPGHLKPDWFNPFLKTRFFNPFFGRNGFNRLTCWVNPGFIILVVACIICLPFAHKVEIVIQYITNQLII